MRSPSEVRERLNRLEQEYDRHDPPSSSVEEEKEVATLRAIEELEWVLDERDADSITT